MLLPRSHHARHLAAAALAVGLGVAALAPAAGAQSAATLQVQLDRQQARERSLQSQVDEFSGLMNRLGSDIAVLQDRQALIEGRLATQQSQLSRLQRTLRVERTRLVALRKRLAYSRGVLARRLVAIYQSGDVDLVTVVLSSDGFAELLERGDFIERVNHQDRQIIVSVRGARDQVARAAARLAVLELRQRQITEEIRRERDEVDANRAALVRKRDSYSAARSGAADALHSTAARRRSLERRLNRLQGTNGDAGSVALSGPWAIPEYIVMCESGGRNTGPNYVGASGYYQIIPSTWRGAGGQGPAAYLAPKAEQDRVARILWNNGLGASNWVCYNGH